MGASTGKRRGRAFNRALSPPVVLGCLPSSRSAAPASTLRLAGVGDVAHTGLACCYTFSGRLGGTLPREEASDLCPRQIQGSPPDWDLWLPVPPVSPGSAFCFLSTHFPSTPCACREGGVLWKTRRDRVESATLACAGPLSGALSLSLSGQSARAWPSMLLPSLCCRSSSCSSCHCYFLLGGICSNYNLINHS